MTTLLPAAPCGTSPTCPCSLGGCSTGPCGSSASPATASELGSSGLSYARALETFRRYGKEPREVQTQFLRELIPQWDKAKVHVALAPVATGKSLLLRAIQEQTDAAIITSENTLVDQYGETFPDLNVLKGKTRYSCKIGDCCAVTYAEAGEYCQGCPYVDAKMRAGVGDPTVYNPMSYLIGVRNGVIEPAPVLLIDEAHKLPGFLRQLGTIELKEKDVGFNDSDVENPARILGFVKKSWSQLKRLVDAKKASGEKAGLKDDVETLDRLRMAINALEHSSGDYFCHIRTTEFKGRKSRTLVVEPMRPPAYFVATLLKSDKIVLTSGTIFPHHVTDLLGDRKYTYTELPAPIPVAQRIVKVEPCTSELNKDTPPGVVAAKVKEIVKRNAGKRGIIHATYSLAEKLKPMMPPEVITHGKEDKVHALEAFKKGGDGVWLLASGMAEGIDLAGDLARVNIITKLQWPNLGDPYVERRLKMKDGQLWYLSSTLEHLIQAAGRTTRGVEDSSITYVLDPGLFRLVEQIKRLTRNDPKKQAQYLPNDFLAALRF